MFINAVIDHNHIWDLGIQLDRYKQLTPGITQTNYKRCTYVSSCPCYEYHDNWQKSKEVDIENMMNR